MTASKAAQNTAPVTATTDTVEDFVSDITTEGMTLVSEGGLWAPDKCKDKNGVAACRGWVLKTEPYVSKKFQSKDPTFFIYMKLTRPCLVVSGENVKRVAQIGETIVTNMNFRLADLQAMADDQEKIFEVQIVAGEKAALANGHTLSNFDVKAQQVMSREDWSKAQMEAAAGALLGTGNGKTAAALPASS